MTKHYILNLDPTAKHDWDRCTVRDPITAIRPELADLIAEAVGEAQGSYLVAVNIEVKVLEQAPLSQPRRVTSEAEPLAIAALSQLHELVA